MKKADYTIVRAPTWITFCCPCCLCCNDLDYDEVLKSCEEEYNLFSGNHKEMVTCEYCGEEVELADVEID